MILEQLLFKNDFFRLDFLLSHSLYIFQSVVRSGSRSVLPVGILLPFLQPVCLQFPVLHHRHGRNRIFFHMNRKPGKHFFPDSWLAWCPLMCRNCDFLSGNLQFFCEILYTFPITKDKNIVSIIRIQLKLKSDSGNQSGNLFSKISRATRQKM